MLVPVRSDFAWWHEYVDAGKVEVCWVRGRITFQGHKQHVPFALCLLILRPEGKPWNAIQKHGSAGGKKAAANMTADQRRERALRAVQAREARRKTLQEPATASFPQK